MNNYPSGMTNADWQHIEGVEHFIQCTAREDHICSCLSDDINDLVCDPCFDLIEVARGETSIYHTSRCESDVCQKICRCEQIQQDLIDDVMLRKADQ